MNLQITIPVGEWLEGTDQRVGLFIGRRVELTSAHTPPWIAELDGVTDRLLYFKSRSVDRKYVQIRLMPNEIKSFLLASFELATHSPTQTLKAKQAIRYLLIGL